MNVVPTKDWTLKWLKLHSNGLTWLKTFLNISFFKWFKLHHGHELCFDLCNQETNNSLLNPTTFAWWINDVIYNKYLKQRTSHLSLVRLLILSPHISPSIQITSLHISPSIQIRHTTTVNIILAMTIVIRPLTKYMFLHIPALWKLYLKGILSVLWDLIFYSSPYWGLVSDGNLRYRQVWGGLHVFFCWRLLDGKIIHLLAYRRNITNNIFLCTSETPQLLSRNNFDLFLEMTFLCLSGH